MFIYSEKIYTPSGYQSGYLEVEDGKIEGIHDTIEKEEHLYFESIHSRSPEVQH